MRHKAKCKNCKENIYNAGDTWLHNGFGHISDYRECDELEPVQPVAAPEFSTIVADFSVEA